MGEYLVYLGIGVMAAGLLFYTKETLQGKNQPNRMTWFLWSVPSLIAASVAYSEGVHWVALLPVLAVGLGPLVVFFASFVNKQAAWKLGKLDYACGAMSLLAIVFWQMTDQPVVAIIFAIISDGLATLPTLIKSWKFPETESGVSYLTAVFGTATSFFVLESWGFIDWAFPAWLVLLNAATAFAIYRKVFNLDLFLGHPRASRYEQLPQEMIVLAQEVAQQPTQREALRFAYDALSKKYRGYRVLTFLRLDRFFITDIETLWQKKGFLHCNHMNSLLRALLVASGKFAPEAIEARWTQIWLFSPHQYLIVTLENGEKVEADLWGRVYGISLGNHAHGLQGGSLFARIES